MKAFLSKNCCGDQRHDQADGKGSMNVIATLKKGFL